MGASNENRAGIRRVVAVRRTGLALPRLEAAVALVDDVDAPAPSHDLAVLVPFLDRLQRVHDFHGAGLPWAAGS